MCTREGFAVLHHQQFGEDRKAAIISACMGIRQLPDDRSSIDAALALCDEMFWGRNTNTYH
jgi:hypothetical protein